MANLANYSGNAKLALGWIHLGWVATCMILAAAVYFVYEYQGRQNEFFRRQISTCMSNQDALQARFNEDESRRAGFEQKIDLEGQGRDKRINDIDRRVKELETPKKKRKKKG